MEEGLAQEEESRSWCRRDGGGEEDAGDGGVGGGVNEAMAGLPCLVGPPLHGDGRVSGAVYWAL